MFPARCRSPPCRNIAVKIVTIESPVVHPGKRPGLKRRAGTNANVFTNASSRSPWSISRTKPATFATRISRVTNGTVRRGMVSRRGITWRPSYGRLPLLSLAVQELLEVLAGPEAGHLRGADADRGLRPGIHPRPGVALRDVKHAEARQGHAVSLFQDPRDRVYDGVEGRRGVLTRQARVVGDGFHDVGFAGHGDPPASSGGKIAGNLGPAVPACQRHRRVMRIALNPSTA